MRRQQILALAIVVSFGVACSDAAPGPVGPDGEFAVFNHHGGPPGGGGPPGRGGEGGGGGGDDPPTCAKQTLMLPATASQRDGAATRDRGGQTWEYYTVSGGTLSLGDATHAVDRADVYLVRMHNGQYRIELDVILENADVLHLLRGNNRARGGEIHLDTDFRVGAGDGTAYGSTGIFADAVGESVHVQGTIQLGENSTATWSLGGEITICSGGE
jgi:hypothetical protein